MLWKTAAALSLAAGLGAASAPAEAQALRKIYFQNACARPVQVLIDSADDYHHWQPHAWYKYAAGEGSYLNDANHKPLRQLEDHSIYGYAETTDEARTLHWQGDGPEVDYQGGLYRTMKFNTKIDEDGDVLVRLTCD